jgi:DNA-binding protein H-NS
VCAAFGQQRREQDEQRISELHKEIAKIDQVLNAEIKRGLERNKTIQAVCPMLP